MLLTEYNEAEVMELFREDGIREGREEGREEGRDKLLINQIHKKLERGKLPETIADEVEESLDNVNSIIEAIKSFGNEEYDDQKVLYAWRISSKKQ